MSQLPITFTKVASVAQGESGPLWLLLALMLTGAAMLGCLSLIARSQGNPLCRWSPLVLLAAIAGVFVLALEDHLLAIPEGGIDGSAWWLVAMIGLAPAMAAAGLLSPDGSRAWAPASSCLVLGVVAFCWPLIELPLPETPSPTVVAAAPETITEPHTDRPVEPAPEAALAQAPAEQDSSPPPAAEPQSEFSFPDLNFAYTTPSTAWRPLERPPVEVDSPDMVLAVADESQSALLAIAVTPEPRESSPDERLERLVARLRGDRPGLRASAPFDMKVGKVAGRALDVSASRRDGGAITRHWVAYYDGVAYQLTYRDESTVPSRFNRGFAAATDGFRPLVEVPQEPTIATLPPVITDTSHCYQLAVDGEDWVRIGANEITPWFEKSAVRFEGDMVDYVGVATLPTQVGEVEAFVDLAHRIINLSMADTQRIGEPKAGLAHATRVIDFSGFRPFRGKVLPVRLRIVVGPHSTHAILAGSSRSTARALADLVDRFQLTGSPPPAEPPVNRLSRHAVAEFANVLGLEEYAAGERRAALREFRIAAEYRPENEAYADNFFTTYMDIEGPSAALQLLDENPPTSFTPAKLALQRAVLLSALERHAEALGQFATAADERPLDDECLLLMGEAATQTENFTETLAAVDAAIAQRGGPLLARWRAVLLSRSGRHDEAIASLEAQAKASPEDSDILYSLAEAYTQADRPAEGVRVCEAAMARFPEADEFLRMIAMIKIVEEDYEAARDVLQACLAKDPGDVDAAELMTTVSALMGRGSNRQITEELAPVPLAPVVAAALNKANAVAPTPEALVSGVFDVYKAVSYERHTGGPLRITERRRFRVLSKAGVESMTMLSADFNPLAERLYVNELVVRDAQNNEVGRASLDDFYAMDDSSDGLDSYNQLVKLPVPGVRPGCTIDLTYTREKRSRRAGFGFHSCYLTCSDGCGVNAVSVTGDLSQVDHRSRGVSPTRPDNQTIAWIAVAPPAAVEEPYQADAEDYLPIVTLSDAGATWQSVTQEYLNDLAESLEPNAEVQRLAASLVRPTDPPARRIEVLARHVQDAVTYQGLEFGSRGVIPHPVERICQVGTGDCKDHALLLHHLLRAAGVTSYLTLVNSSGSVEAGLPSMDQFDHMVVAVPNMPRRDGSVTPLGVIDATNKTLDPLHGAPSGLANELVMVLAPNQDELSVAPAALATDGAIDCRRTAEIVEVSPELGSAKLRVAETVEFGSALSAMLRASLQGTAPNAQREWIKRMVDGRHTVEVSEASIDNLNDPCQPLRIHCRYEIDNAFQEVAVAGRPLTGSLPGHWARLYCTPEKAPNRQTPFKFSAPVTFRGTTELRAPSGYRVASESTAPLGAATGPFTWSWRCDPAAEGGASLAFEVHRSAGAYPADQYAGYQAAAEQALRAAGRSITVTRTELAARP